MKVTVGVNELQGDRSPPPPPPTPCVPAVVSLHIQCHHGSKWLIRGMKTLNCERKESWLPIPVLSRELYFRGAWHRVFPYAPFSSDLTRGFSQLLVDLDSWRRFTCVPCVCDTVLKPRPSPEKRLGPCELLLRVHVGRIPARGGVMAKGVMQHELNYWTTVHTRGDAAGGGGSSQTLHTAYVNW